MKHIASELELADRMEVYA
jgi:hypothetical protein